MLERPKLRFLCTVTKSDDKFPGNRTKIKAVTLTLAIIQHHNAINLLPFLKLETVKYNMSVCCSMSEMVFTLPPPLHPPLHPRGRGCATGRLKLKVFTGGTSITKKHKHQNILIHLLALQSVNFCRESCACTYSFIASEHQTLG